MMTKRLKALRDKYLPALLGLLLLTFGAQAQVLQKQNGYGMEFKRLQIDTSLGIPADTLPLSASQKSVPHFAAKGEDLYRWSVSQQKWVQIATTSSAVDTLPLSVRINDLEARRDTLSITQLDSLHIIICQPSIGVCDTLEFSAASGTAISYPYTARKYLNGYGAFPTLNSDSLDEGGTNLFFTNARVRAALSAGAPLTYNSSTGVFGITQATTSTDGYLSSTDWNTFNNKQAALVSGTNIKTVNGNSLLGSGDVTIAGGGSSTDTVFYKRTITEQRIYYRGEYVADKQISTSTGAVSANSGTAISDYLPVTASESITISAPAGYGNITVYGWTYDATLTPISEIRSNALIGTTVSSYTFTTPSNAAYLNLYVKYNGRDFAKTLQIRSTSAITYAVPITPEQFSGSNSSEKIQAALDFARFTSSPVVVQGDYTIDSTLYLSSGNYLVLNGARLKLKSGSHTNIIRNESAKNPNQIFARGNRSLGLVGIGSAIIEGSDENWGSDSPTGVGTQSWRSIGTLLANVENFEVRGVTFKNTNSWAMNMEQSRLGLVENITVLQDSSHANQDGINIRRGSNRITLQNIKGRTGDDLVALTNIVIRNDINILSTTLYEPYKTDWDIHSILLKNIQRDTMGIFASVAPTPFYKTGVLLLCEDGLKIHDVTIDGVSGPQQVQLGFTAINYVQTTAATVNDMYNINVSNTGGANIRFARPIKQSSFVNIAPTELSGAVNCVFQNGSMKVYRKYTNKHPEYFDSTSATSYYQDLAFGTQDAEGIRVTNRGNANAISDFMAVNRWGDRGVLRQYNTFGGGIGLDSATGILASRNLILISSEANASGGTNSIQFRTGGYNAAQERMRIDHLGRVGIGKSPATYKLEMKVDNAGADGAELQNNTAGGSTIMRLLNNSSGNVAQFTNYGSTFSLSHLANNTGFLSQNDLYYIVNQNVASGGTKKHVFLAGGYNANQERMRITTSGVSVMTQADPTSALTTTSFGAAYVSKATSYTATASDYTIEVTATGQTITLPTAASISGRIYTIKLTASGTATVATTSSQTIDGATTYSLSAQYKYVTVQSNGTNWLVIANN